jgi:hypothetical protein
LFNQFLLTKISLPKFFDYKRHLWRLLKIPAIEKTHFISI